VSECDRETSTMWRPRPSTAVEALEKNIHLCFQFFSVTEFLHQAKEILVDKFRMF
jgi:hypothetical protein